MSNFPDNVRQSDIDKVYGEEFTDMPYLEDVYMYPSEILIALSGKLSDEDRYTWALTLIGDLEDALEITIEALDPSKREVTLKDIIQKYNPYLREDLLK